MSDIYVSYETYISENDLFSLFKLLGLLSFDHHAPTSFKLIFALFSVRFYSVYKVLLQCAFLSRGLLSLAPRLIFALF